MQKMKLCNIYYIILYIYILRIMVVCCFLTSMDNQRRFDRFVSAVISCAICSPGDCRFQEVQKSCILRHASQEFTLTQGTLVVVVDGFGRI